MKIAWLNDFGTKEFLGGATVTGSIMIEKGRELGYEIDEISVKSHQEELIKNIELLKDYDLIILNNINMFKLETIEWIIHNTNYITYNHDFSFCRFRSCNCEQKCGNLRCTPAKFFKDMFANSLLNIFFSPLQLNIYKPFFGQTLRDAIYLPAPVKKGLFYPV